jgi:hypothetical protein
LCSCAESIEWSRIPEVKHVVSCSDAELSEGLNRYSSEVEELFTPIWEKEYGWAEGWMEVMDPPEKIQARKRAYYARKEREKVEGSRPK